MWSKSKEEEGKVLKKKWHGYGYAGFEISSNEYVQQTLE
jgi:hypothetical protein